MPHRQMIKLISQKRNNLAFSDLPLLKTELLVRVHISTSEELQCQCLVFKSILWDHAFG